MSQKVPDKIDDMWLDQHSFHYPQLLDKQTFHQQSHISLKIINYILKKVFHKF